LPGVTVLEQSGEGAALVAAWETASRVIIVDAVSSGGEPGVIHRLEVDDQPLPAHFSGKSTHAFGLAEAIELARQLDRLPTQLLIIGIEGKSYNLATGLSPEVEAAIPAAIMAIRRELPD
jgi:hydrogenase maturation protease